MGDKNEMTLTDIGVHKAIVENTIREALIYFHHVTGQTVDGIVIDYGFNEPIRIQDMKVTSTVIIKL